MKWRPVHIPDRENWTVWFVGSTLASNSVPSSFFRFYWSSSCSFPSILIYNYGSERSSCYEDYFTSSYRSRCLVVWSSGIIYYFNFVSYSWALWNSPCWSSSSLLLCSSSSGPESRPTLSMQNLWWSTLLYLLEINWSLVISYSNELTTFESNWGELLSSKNFYFCLSKITMNMSRSHRILNSIAFLNNDLLRFE